MGVYHYGISKTVTEIDGVKVAKTNFYGKEPGVFCDDARLKGNWDRFCTKAYNAMNEHRYYGVEYMRYGSNIVNARAMFNDTGDWLGRNIVGKIVKEGRKNVIEWLDR